MPAISGRSHEAKKLMCDTMKTLMTAEIGKDLVMNFKDKRIVWRRIPAEWIK